MSQHDRAMAAKSELIGAMREQHVTSTGSEPDAKAMRKIEEKARQTAERVNMNKQYRYNPAQRRR